jgi:hypothetical protein
MGENFFIDFITWLSIVVDWLLSCLSLCTFYVSFRSFVPLYCIDNSGIMKSGHHYMQNKRTHTLVIQMSVESQHAINQSAVNTSSQ